MSKSTDDLAAHISAILNHPDTPVSLYNALAEELLDLSDRAMSNVIGSPEVLRVALPLLLAKMKSMEDVKATPEARPMDELRTRRLIIMDDAGQERAVLETFRDVTGPGHSSVVLSMFDAAGDLRLTARVGDNGEATFNAFSRQEPFGGTPEDGLTVQRLCLGCTPSDPDYVKQSGRKYHTPELTFFDGDEATRSKLTLGANGAARLEFFDLMGGLLMGLQERGLLVWADGKQITHCYLPERPADKDQ